MTELSSRLHSWMASGSFREADGVSLWYRIEGRAQSHLPWLVCFHGFPTSSRDWRWLIPLLRERFRILVFDFPGYGLSGKPPRRSYSILRQLDAAESLILQLEIPEFHLLSHDMGDTVACELLHRIGQGESGLRPVSLALLNGGIFPEMHKPLPTQRLLRTPVIGEVTARLASWALFRQQYPKVYAQAESFSDEHYREQWSLLLNNDGRKVMAKLACYMHERRRFRKRWPGALFRTDLPVRIIWGAEDPISGPEMARRLAAEMPRAQVDILPGVGHYPQIEAPERVANILKKWV